MKYRNFYYATVTIMILICATWIYGCEQRAQKPNVTPNASQISTWRSGNVTVEIVSPQPGSIISVNKPLMEIEVTANLYFSSTLSIDNNTISPANLVVKNRREEIVDRGQMETNDSVEAGPFTYTWTRSPWIGEHTVKLILTDTQTGESMKFNWDFTVEK